jgi:hypothetical protein
MGAPHGQNLHCDECGRRSDARAQGWRAVHVREYPNDQPATFFFCVDCWECEFRDDTSYTRILWLWDEGKGRA